MIVVGDGGVRMHAELVVHAFNGRSEGIERDATANLGSPRRRAVTVHDLVRLARRTTRARRGGRARAKVVRAVGLERGFRWSMVWCNGRCDSCSCWRLRNDNGSGRSRRLGSAPRRGRCSKRTGGRPRDKRRRSCSGRNGQRLRSTGAGESGRGGRDEGLHADVREFGLHCEVRDDIRRGLREDGLRCDGARNLVGDVLDELGGRAASVRDREDGDVVLDIAVAPH